MGYIQGDDRNQYNLFVSLEDYIQDNSYVKVIDYYINTLDLEEYNFKYKKSKKFGRPSYNPKTMLKLFIYGYINKIISSRNLEREAKLNIELKWLLKNLAPDYRTICYFLSNNADNVKKIYNDFRDILKSENLFSKNKVAVDSGKIKAVNSKRKHFTKKGVKKNIEKLEEGIDRYLNKLIENCDKDNEENIKDLIEETEEYAEKIRKYIKKKEKLKKMKNKMEEKNINQLSLTDKDSRMINKNGKMQVCYNPHITVENKNKFIIDYEVSNEASDQKFTSKMAINAKNILREENEEYDKNFEALMDKGYFEFTEIKKCIDNGIDLYVPHYNFKGKKEYSKDKFKYDKEKDVYICPNGKELKYVGNYIKKNKKNKEFRHYVYKECKNCKDKDKCTKSKSRTIARWVYEELIEEHRKKMKKCKSKHSQRAAIVEHVVGNIKVIINKSEFTVKGMRMVKAQFGLAALAYNFKKAIKIMGTEGLIEAIRRKRGLKKGVFSLFFIKLTKKIKNRRKIKIFYNKIEKNHKTLKIA